MDKRKIALEGETYEVSFSVKRLCKLEALSGKRVDQLLDGEPKLTDIMLILSVGIGLDDIIDLERLPEDFTDVLQVVMESLSYAMGGNLKPKKSKGKPKKK